MPGEHVGELRPLLKFLARPVLAAHLGERAVEHELRFWISDPESGLGNIQGEVFLGIWDRFKEAGIRIPYPRSEVRLIERDADA